MPDSQTLTEWQIDHVGLDQLETVAAQIITFSGNLKIWLLEGEMGAGKTTLAKAICRQLGVSSAVHSPTYSLVNEYEGVDGQLIYHFDFYRIKDESEAMDIGIEEYFDSGNYCLVEWPSKVASLIPDEHLRIAISTINNQRTIHLSRHGQ